MGLSEGEPLKEGIKQDITVYQRAHGILFTVPELGK